MQVCITQNNNDGSKSSRVFFNVSKITRSPSSELLIHFINDKGFEQLHDYSIFTYFLEHIVLEDSEIYTVNGEED